MLQEKMNTMFLGRFYDHRIEVLISQLWFDNSKLILLGKEHDISSQYPSSKNPFPDPNY